MPVWRRRPSRCQTDVYDFCCMYIDDIKQLYIRITETQLTSTPAWRPIGRHTFLLNFVCSSRQWSYPFSTCCSFQSRDARSFPHPALNTRHRVNQCCVDSVTACALVSEVSFGTTDAFLSSPADFVYAMLSRAVYWCPQNASPAPVQPLPPRHAYTSCLPLGLSFNLLRRPSRARIARPLIEHRKCIFVMLFVRSQPASGLQNAHIFHNVNSFDTRAHGAKVN